MSKVEIYFEIFGLATDEDGKYDEIACEKHKEKLKQHASNKMKNKELVVKETIGPQKRGENI